MLPFQKIKDFISDISGSNTNQDGTQSNNNALNGNNNTVIGGGATNVNGAALRQDRKRSSWNDLTNIFRLSIKDNNHHDEHNQHVRFENGIANGQMMQGQPGHVPYNQAQGQQYHQGKPSLRQNGQHQLMPNGSLVPKKPILTTRNSAPNLSQYQYNGNVNGSQRHGQQRPHHVNQQQQQQQHRRQSNASVDNFYPGDVVASRSSSQHTRQQQQQQQHNPHHHQQHLQPNMQQRGHTTKSTNQTKTSQSRGHQMGYNQQQQQQQQQQQHNRYDQYSNPHTTRLLQQTNQQPSHYHSPQYGSHQSLTTSIPISSSSQPVLGTQSPRTSRRHFQDHRSSPRTIPDNNSNQHLSILQGRNTVGSAPSSFNYNRQGPLDQLTIDGRLVNGNDHTDYQHGNPLLSPMMARHNQSHHCSSASINSNNGIGSNTNFNTISTPASSFTSTTYSGSNSLNGSHSNINNYGHRGLNSHDMIQSHHDGLLTNSIHHHDDHNGRIPTSTVNRDDINKNYTQDMKTVSSALPQSSKPRSLLAEARRESFRESKAPSRMRPISPSQHYIDDPTMDHGVGKSNGQTQEYYDQMIAQINDQIAKAVEQRPYGGFGNEEDENDWC